MTYRDMAPGPRDVKERTLSRAKMSFAAITARRSQASPLRDNARSKHATGWLTFRYHDRNVSAWFPRDFSAQPDCEVAKAMLRFIYARVSLTNSKQAGGTLLSCAQSRTFVPTGEACRRAAVENIKRAPSLLD